MFKIPGRYHAACKGSESESALFVKSKILQVLGVED